MAEDTVYLTVGKHARSSGILAVLSQGSPQRGDVFVTVLAMEIFKTEAEARAWAEKTMAERPWEVRH